ncbi:hypothetical protein An14g03960 [Aspergillus niger]|uniref:Uncharacterized protein n=2 Tax=Aspergillus niger TaxID=5061 RepID=A2R3E0_ASPNC|nr:hypothetical protein An14g03960 [Aspergillus niger]CAK46632.1 hypothetical protein An14g03960 [Aspergillus niger]
MDRSEFSVGDSCNRYGSLTGEGADEARRCAHGGGKGGQAERGGPCDPKETSESEKGTAGGGEGMRVVKRIEYPVCKAERETKKGKGERERERDRVLKRGRRRSKPVTAEGSPDLVGGSPGRHLGSASAVCLNGRNEHQFPRAAEASVAADPGRFRTYLRH